MIYKENWNAKCYSDAVLTTTLSHSITLVTTYFCSWGCACKEVLPAANGAYSQTRLNKQSQQCHYSNATHRRKVRMLLIKFGSHIQNTSELFSALVPEQQRYLNISSSRLRFLLRYLRVHRHFGF